MILLATRYWFPIKDKFGQVNLNLTWTLIFAFGLYTFGCSINASFEELEKEETAIEVIEFVKVKDKEQAVAKAKEEHKKNTFFTPDTVEKVLIGENQPKKPLNKLYLLYCQMALDKKLLVESNLIS